MKTLNLYILLLLLALVSACEKKKYPPSVVENVSVYKFQAKIGGMAISLNAGLEGYYMYSSYAQDSNNIYNYTAALKQANCTDCRNSLKVQINDFKVSLPNQPAKIDSSLFPHTYLLLAGSNLYNLQFHSEFNKTAAAYKWDFGDGTSSTDANPLHTYNKAGNYKVNLKITSNSGCQSTIQNIEQVNANTNNLKASISALSLGNTISFAPIITGGKAPYSLLWNYGDGTGSNNTGNLHTYAVTGSYPVTVRVTDADHNTVIVNRNVATQSDLSSCITNYNMSIVTQTIEPVIERSLSKIIISWTDENGLVYTSNNELQPSTSHFEILSVEDAGLNENNEPTKKLRLKFNCKVYNGTNVLSIDDAETTICVAYK